MFKIVQDRLRGFKLQQAVLEEEFKTDIEYKTPEPKCKMLSKKK